jgi:hypothetical protein
VFVGLRGCDQGGGFNNSKRKGEANIMHDGTVDLLKGTGVDGDSRPPLQVKVLALKD